MSKHIKVLARKALKLFGGQEEHLRKIGAALAALAVTALGIVGFPGQGALGGQQGDTYAHAEEVVLDDSLQQINLCVYICGQVANPGVYYVTSGSRICDVVDQAGGFTPNAAVETLNLAREVKDGEQITVRSEEELSFAYSGTGQDGACRININGATAEQLQQIPGVGPSLSQKIVSYRNAQGAFASVDDLRSVSGIGEKKLDSMRDYICV